MLTYVVKSWRGDIKSQYVLDWDDLVDTYKQIIGYTDEEFLKNLHQVIHFAVFACDVKNMGYEGVKDEGIIHRLVHLLCDKHASMFSFDDNYYEILHDIREQFKEQLKFD